MAVQSIMFLSSFLLFVSVFLTKSDAIRVDWNTNTGPIVPATSTIPPVPKPPYRNPAPVWEDQSNDIPNPHQYKYVLPPPSRPRYNQDYNPGSSYKEPQPVYNYGKLIDHPNQISSNVKSVPGLSVQYIPNVGLRYYAVVPQQQINYQQKQDYLGNNYIYDKYDKINGAYNAKLKKYKAYEKAYKNVPYYVYFSHPKQQDYTTYYTSAKSSVSKS